MSSLAIACVMFVCVLASTLAAIAIARRLPEHHRSTESKEVVKLGLGVIATLTALVLGLLVASAKGTYDTQSNSVKELSAQLALLDRILERYGPETAEARAQLRAFTRALLEQFWPHDGSAPTLFPTGEAKSIGETFFDTLTALKPKTDTQQMLKARAIDAAAGLAQSRQRLVVNNERSIPSPLLVVLGFWQAVLFAGFGLLAPRNATTLTVLVVCMLSIAGAIFLVMEFDRPFDGLIRVSDAPIRTVLSRMGE
jgi:hypothetical protein